MHSGGDAGGGSGLISTENGRAKRRRYNYKSCIHVLGVSCFFVDIYITVFLLVVLFGVIVAAYNFFRRDLPRHPAETHTRSESGQTTMDHGMVFVFYMHSL